MEPNPSPQYPLRSDRKDGRSYDEEDSKQFCSTTLKSRPKTKTKSKRQQTDQQKNYFPENVPMNMLNHKDSPLLVTSQDKPVEWGVGESFYLFIFQLL